MLLHNLLEERMYHRSLVGSVCSELGGLVHDAGCMYIYACYDLLRIPFYFFLIHVGGRGWLERRTVQSCAHNRIAATERVEEGREDQYLLLLTGDL